MLVAGTELKLDDNSYPCNMIGRWATATNLSLCLKSFFVVSMQEAAFTNYSNLSFYHSKAAVHFEIFGIAHAILLTMQIN